MINDAMFSSNTNEWATPQAFFDELNKYNAEHGTSFVPIWDKTNDPKN